MNSVTETKKYNKSFKRRKLPKFPSALVVIFFVLLFVVILSWIPHKGWIDSSSPFLLIENGFIYGPNGDQWGIIDAINLKENGIEVDTITFHLTKIGANALGAFLLNQGVDKVLVCNIVEVSKGSEAFIISEISLYDDWNQAAINYSGLTFNLSLNGDFKNANGVPLSFENMEVTIDQIFQNSSLIYDNVAGGTLTQDQINSMSFAILNGSIDTKILTPNPSDKDATTIMASFVYGDIANNWFNFWDSNYYVGDANGRYGILNIPFILLGGLFNAANVILFLLCIGAFVEVMLYSGALEAGTSSLVKKLDGKELLLIPVLFTLFCIGGTTFGMQEETLGLIPLIIPFLVLAGFDTMTGLLIIVVGTTSGIAASVLDPFSIGVMASSLSIESADQEAITIGTGITIRIIMFIVFLISGSSFCTWYGHRSRKGKDFVAEPAMYEKNKEWAHQMLGESHDSHIGLNRRQTIGLIIFGTTFVIMVFSILPWTTWFDDLETNKAWIIFSSLFFANALFGEWYFVQLALLFLIAAFILGIVFGMKQRETNKAMLSGMKGSVKVSMILVLSRSVALVLTYSGLTTGMIVMMFGGGSGQGEINLFGLAWILFPVFLFLAIFIPSTSGLAAITGPLIAPIIWQLAASADDQAAMFGVYAIIVMVTYPLAQGTINMFMPTTGIVVAQAEISKVSFGKAFPILGCTALGTMILGMIVISGSIAVMSM